MAPPDRNGALVQGTLDMLILKTLALEPQHGFGIGVRIQQISRGVFTVNAGSLVPALRRLERDGLVTTEWRASDNNRRAKLLRADQGRANDARAGDPGLAGADAGDCADPARQAR